TDQTDFVPGVEQRASRLSSRAYANCQLLRFQIQQYGLIHQKVTLTGGSLSLCQSWRSPTKKPPPPKPKSSALEVLGSFDGARPYSPHEHNPTHQESSNSPKARPRSTLCRWRNRGMAWPIEAHSPGVGA